MSDPIAELLNRLDTQATAPSVNTISTNTQIDALADKVREDAAACFAPFSSADKAGCIRTTVGSVVSEANIGFISPSETQKLINAGWNGRSPSDY